MEELGTGHMFPRVSMVTADELECPGCFLSVFDGINKVSDH